MSAPAKVIVFSVESPAERAAHSAAVALGDLGDAIWTAKTRAELIVLRDMAEALIAQLIAAARVARTLDEHFDERTA